MRAYKNQDGFDISAQRPLTSAKGEMPSRSASFAPGALKQAAKKDDVTSVGPSQYQSIYPMGELQSKGLAMHDLLASEYDMGNVAITKMRPKKPQQQKQDDGRNIRHEDRKSSPDERG